MMTSMLVMLAAALAVTPAPQDSSRWRSRVEEKSQQVSKGGSQIVFLGDAFIHYLEEPWGAKPIWEVYWAGVPYKALNLGCSGDTTENVLWRITEGRELEGYDAKAIVLMVGLENFARRGDPAGDVITGVDRILHEIRERQPGARTILCSLFPRGGDPLGDWHDRIEVVNREIQKYANGREVIWCDCTDRVKGLDPTEAAIAWTSVVMPIVNEILRGDGLPIAPRCRSVQHVSEEDKRRPSTVRPVSRIMVPGPRGENWWGERFGRNRDFIYDHRDCIDFVFAGSSSIHFWETQGGKEYAALTNKYVILNCGYGGDATQNLLWRFRNGELDGYRAKGFVLSIGSNNNGVKGAKTADTVAGIRACLDLIVHKQPTAKVVLLAYQPRAVGTKDGDPRNDGGADQRNRETSAEMAKMADGKNIFYVDVYDRFLRDGKLPRELSADYIHPTEKGYEIIRKALEPVLEKIMKEGT